MRCEIGNFTVGLGRMGMGCIQVRRMGKLDAGQYALRDEEDAARNRELMAYGYRVIRFWNNQVIGDLAGVLEVIRQELGG
jgi:very-short-patch-repair endonuclease